MRERPAKEYGFDTRAIHAGQRPDPYTGARAVPIFQTTSYVFEDPDSAAAYFNLWTDDRARDGFLESQAAWPARFAA